MECPVIGSTVVVMVVVGEWATRSVINKSSMPVSASSPPPSPLSRRCVTHSRPVWFGDPKKAKDNYGLGSKVRRNSKVSQFKWKNMSNSILQGCWFCYKGNSSFSKPGPLRTFEYHIMLVSVYLAASVIRKIGIAWNLPIASGGSVYYTVQDTDCSLGSGRKNETVVTQKESYFPQLSIVCLHVFKWNSSCRSNTRVLVSIPNPVTCSLLLYSESYTDAIRLQVYKSDKSHREALPMAPFLLQYFAK